MEIAPEVVVARVAGAVLLIVGKTTAVAAVSSKKDEHQRPHSGRTAGGSEPSRAISPAGHHNCAIARSISLPW